MQGKFVISLDFELHWGAAEKWDLKVMKGYFDTTRASIPVVLSLFEKYNIHATWATVGFLFAKDKEQLLAFCPKDRPSYKNELLSYYRLIDGNEVGNNENDDPYHYAPSLISRIIETPGQELATHTFAHYYCNEPGQTERQFESDIQAAQAIAKENYGLSLRSLVYPRNQFNSVYTQIAYDNAIRVVRTNPDVWFWKSSSRFIPIARAFDTVMPISGPLTYKEKPHAENEMLQLPASRFFRPYVKKEQAIRAMKLKRIEDEMLYAAKNNEVYHLWWHPHNFGYSVDENLADLQHLLLWFAKLNGSYGFTSSSMIEMYKG